MHNLAPIALFVYNRPSHTRKTLEHLMANNLAGKSSLFIFSDGPKINASPEDIVKISEVRRVIREKKWCGEVTIRESKTNAGLANSIISGVTQLVREHGKVIVLEDDLLTSRFFLDYMNTALVTYQDEAKVMQVCGYTFPIETSGLNETFFLRLTSSWGWGTWDRAWKHFEEDARVQYNNFPQSMIHSFNLNGAYNYYSFFKSQLDKRIDSWAIRWYCNVFLLNGLCLYPSSSLVFNCGNDNSGVHSGKTNIFDTALYDKKIRYYEDNIVENSTALERIKDFFHKTAGQSFIKPTIARRLLNRLRIS
jgi:hypothetical protein